MRWFAGGLVILTADGRHHAVLDAALAEGWRALEEHEDAIRAQVRARTSWVWRLIALDARASDALISSIEDTLQAIAHDRDHPARLRITEMIRRFADELQNSPERQQQVERVAAEMLSHPAVSAYFQDLWRSLKAGLRASGTEPRSQTRAAFADAIERFGAALLDDEAVVEALNARLRGLLTEVSGRHGRDVGRLISETIRNWETKTVVEKLEQSIGPDLQFIRINGTIIGGLIGLAIHQATLWLT
jgi:uncharacterized membrane-anchored protein YjiN (DUF445 family)